MADPATDLESGATCHDTRPLDGPEGHVNEGTGIPRPAIALATLLGVTTVVSVATIALVPFDTAMFGRLTTPVVLASGVADGFNPCAFALLVLFATYTLTLVNTVTADGTPTVAARRTLLGAGSLYVMAVVVTYFIIGLGLFSFLAWLGQDHLVARAASVIALVMAIWMLKDVFLPGVGPSMMAPSGTKGWMHRAMSRGGLAGMLIAGVLVGICTVPCSGAIYLDIVAVLHASGGGPVGLALLALYNIAFIAPLLALLLLISDRRVLGRLGRWNQRHGSTVKVVLALAVVAMTFGLLMSM
jgi:cytochrome c biogenesis protein CcdA